MVIFSPRIFSVSATFCGHEHTCCSFIQQGLAKFYRCNTQYEGKMLCIRCCRCCCCSFIQQGFAKFTGVTPSTKVKCFAFIVVVVVVGSSIQQGLAEFCRCNTQYEGKMPYILVVVIVVVLLPSQILSPEPLSSRCSPTWSCLCHMDNNPKP